MIIKMRFYIALFLTLFTFPRAQAEPQSQYPGELLRAQGILQYQVGDFTQATSILQQAHARLPEDVTTAHFLGLSLIRQGQIRAGRQLLAEAARRDGENTRLLKDLGLAYLAEGNYPWAIRVLTHVVELSPQDGRAHQYLGIALLRLGEASAAADVLSLAKELPGTDRDQTTLELSWALFQIKRWEETRLQLDPLLNRKSQSPFARQLLRAVYQAEGIPASLVSAELSVGSAIDTNPLYEHETTAPTAVGPMFGGQVTVRPWVDAHNLWEGGLAGNRMFYFNASAAPSADKDVSQASISEIQAFAAYHRRWSNSHHPLQLSFGYNFGLTFLDGDPPLADQNHIFVEENEGQVRLERSMGKNASGALQYSLIRLDYALLARSNWGNELSLEHNFFTLNERLRLLMWLSCRHESAHSPDYTTIVPGGGLGSSVLGPLGLVLGIRFGYEYKNHYDSDGGRWGRQREDHQLAFNAELNHALPYSLRLRAIYQRQQNFSTVTSFDYHRDLLTLTLSWSSL